MKKIRLSFIFKNFEVVFNISCSWVKIRLHCENQLPRLPKTALIVMSPGGGVVVFLTDNNTTTTKISPPRSELMLFMDKIRSTTLGTLYRPPLLTILTLSCQEEQTDLQA